MLMIEIFRNFERNLEELGRKRVKSRARVFTRSNVLLRVSPYILVWVYGLLRVTGCYASRVSLRVITFLSRST